MNDYKVYGYRWVVLLAFALANMMVQIHWVTFAPVTDEAAAYYGVTALQIGFLSMLYMLVYIFLCVPASYVIDTYGLRFGVGTGAVLMGVFGMLKWMYAEDYKLVFMSQVGLAVAQPFIINAITKIGAEWFPEGERATAAGLATLSQYVGIIFAMVLTPVLLKSSGMKGMLAVYGAASAAIMIVFIAAARNRPPTPPGPAGEVSGKFGVFEGIGHMAGQKDVLLLLLLFFIGLGMFNAVTTWIEQILAPRGINPEQAGLVGAAMMVGGVIGAVVLPVLSDRMRRRKPFIILCMAGVVPGLAGLAFLHAFGLLLASGFVLGFFIMSAGPIGFQYGAELSRPAPESTSQGMILLVGQVSGMLFIFGMDRFRSAGTGDMTPSMIVLIILTAVALAVATAIRESPISAGSGTIPSS